MSYYELMVFKWMGFAILGGCTLPAIFFVLIEMASFRADFVRGEKKHVSTMMCYLTAKTNSIGNC